MRTFTLISILLFFITSCNTPARMAHKCQKAQLKYEAAAAKWNCPIIKDSNSVRTLVVIKDTTIYVPIPGENVHDSILVTSIKGILNSNISTLETKYAISKAWVADGILKHILEQKNYAIPITIPGAIQTATTNSVHTIKVPYYIDRPVAKPFVWWQKSFFWTGLIFFFLLIGYIFLKFFKFRSY